ncbi:MULTISPECIES: ABC transporter permease [unclassified Granulicatella]|uniref:ABC transporter permease n=1 Tax=unclassified Granulicatella TaxID=2630493 RepID=UPI0025531399|nr:MULTISPECIES: ABC transporter permease [unclassified Granulicatella]MDK8381262.1 ABC transporter permease [Granulicatella sp. UMB5615B]MDK8522801.1 ABC transporter permease [Granulicatella sp. UMB5615A]
MRYIRYIKANLISALKSFPALLLMVLMPFLLTLFLAFTTKGAFNPSDLTIETKIYIDNQDKGAFGEQIVALFAQLTEEKQIALTSVKDDAKIIATIPADFTESIQTRSQATPITIEKSGRTSSLSLAVYESLLKTMTSQLLEASSVMHEVAESKNASITPEQAAGMLASLQQEIASGAFETDQVEAESQVTANQHYAITGLGFLFIIFLENAMRFGVQRELSGLRKRLNVLPFSICERNRLDLAVNMIATTLLSFVYIGLWKILDPTTFGGNIGSIFVLIVFYSLVFNVLGNLLGNFVTEKNLQAFSTGINLGYMLFSGLIPLDRVSSTFSFLSGNPFRQFTYTPFVDVMNGVSMKGMAMVAAPIILVLGLVFNWSLKRKEARQ